MADITLVGLLSRMDPKMALQLEGVRAGVGAVGTLERSLASVTPEIE